MIYLEASDDEAAAAILKPLKVINEVEKTSKGLVITITADGSHCLPVIMGRLKDQGLSITTVNLKKPTLDDVFVHYTGRELRDVGAERMTSRMFGRGTK
jgi:ABC-2 type transport system ATP-binding protein